MRRNLLAILFTVFLPALARAHEFWIEPMQWQIPLDDPMRAHIRVGENMKGAALSYLPGQTRRFDLATPAGIFAVDSRIGDRPALDTLARHEGLNVVIHVTGDSELDYSEAEKFSAFVRHKDLGDTLAEHARRGLPKTHFTERYSRYAKALVAVGHGRGQDRDLALTTEITALSNPYTDDLSGGLRVRVTYRGVPRADARVEVFDRAPGRAPKVSTTRTDAAGIATIMVTPGHDYMLDAVVMRPLTPENPGDPVWESLWANLTFHVPAD